MATPPSPPAVPPEWFQGGFHRFLRPYLKRHFHSLAITKPTGWNGRGDRSLAELIGDRLPDESVPLIVYANHPSWWDPLIAHFINDQLFAPRQFYAPIDAEALKQYAVFEKLGFFGVSLEDRQGAADFLHVTRQILHRPATALWITPEGRFTDVRDHDATLQPGIAHLAAAISRSARRVESPTTRSSDSPARAVILPVALEYPFWQERLPECLATIGQPFDTAEYPHWSKRDWSEALLERLRQTQLDLASKTIGRTSEPFINLLHGRAGTGGLLEPLRRLSAWRRGQTYRPSHGEAFENH